jgi:hypothetical protein
MTRSSRAEKAWESLKKLVTPISKSLKAEKVIDRHALPSGGNRFHEVEHTSKKGHITIRWYDIGAVHLNLHTIFNLGNLHACVASHQICKQALVVRGTMLDQDKGHARIGIGRHTGEEGFKGCQASCGCSEAYNRKWNILFCCRCRRLSAL